MSHVSGYFHTDKPRTLAWLSSVFAQALVDGNAVRLITRDGGLMVKVGGGQWTPVLLSSPDANREQPVTLEAKP